MTEVRPGLWWSRMERKHARAHPALHRIRICRNLTTKFFTLGHSLGVCIVFLSCICPMPVSQLVVWGLKKARLAPQSAFPTRRPAPARPLPITLDTYGISLFPRCDRRTSW